MSTAPFKYLLTTTTLLTSILLSGQVHASGIEGTWQTFDDKTGLKKALIKFTYDKNTGKYTGRITKLTPIIGYKPITSCVKCSGVFKDKPVIGLPVIWNLTAIKKDGKIVGYQGGKILDPTTGKIYNYSAKLSASNQTLKSRAYAENKTFGRTQSWIRQ